MAGRLFLLGVVGVFRQCRACRRLFRARTGRSQPTCWTCEHRLEHVGHLGATSRAYALTDKGRAALAEMQAGAA